MKRAKNIIIALLCLLWLPFFMAVWDKDKPASSTSLRSSNPEMLANQDALETAISQDHEFSTGGTNSGKHEVLTMEEESSAGASSTNELHVQAIDGGSGQPEFAITSEDGDELQMTKDGDLYSSDNLQVVGTSTFTGTVIASGAVTVGTTLDVTGNIDPTTYETTNGGFLDEDDMASDAADKVSSQQALKKYVDDSVTAVNGQADATSTTTTTSASFGDLDSMSVTVTATNGSKVFIIFSCTYFHNVLGQSLSFRLRRDTTSLVVRSPLHPADASFRNAMSLQWLDTADGSSHTYKIQWLTSAATASVFDRTLTVFEVRTGGG